jgi:hypothetical protein
MFKHLKSKNKVKAIPQLAPRTNDEINTEASRTAYDLGMAVVSLELKEDEIRRLKAKILELGKEQERRIELDKANAAKAEVPNAV